MQHSDEHSAAAVILEQEDSPEERYHHLQAAKARKEDLLVLLNPRDYLIHPGDKAFVIAVNTNAARQLTTFGGVFPPALAELASISTADKRSFCRLNGGQGPLIQLANMGVVLPEAAFPTEEQTPVDLVEAAAAAVRSSADATSALDAANTDIEPLLSDRSENRPPPRGPARLKPLATAAGFSSTQQLDVPVVLGTARVDAAPPCIDTEEDVYSGRIVADATRLVGHILFCGPGVAPRLRDFIDSLVSCSASCIVALYPFKGTDADEISVLVGAGLPPEKLARIFLLNGSSSSHVDLVRAGIATASCAIIVPSNSSSRGDQNAQQSLSAGAAESVVDTEDTDVLFTACVIESTFPHTRILIEVPNAGALRYLSFRPYLSDSCKSYAESVLDISP